MKKIDSLLKKVELFEKLAIYGDRTSLLNSLAQEMSEVDPNSPSQEKNYSGTYDPAQNPVPNTVVPEMTFYAPKTNQPKAPSSAAVQNALTVMQKYMNEKDYASKPEYQAGVDKVWKQVARAFGITDTGLGYQIKQLQDQMVSDPYASNEQKDFDQKKMQLLRFREQDMKKRMGVV